MYVQIELADPSAAGVFPIASAGWEAGLDPRCARGPGRGLPIPSRKGGALVREAEFGYVGAMADPLDLTHFIRSLHALERALALSGDEDRVGLLGEDGPEVVMSHVIKSFELAYETALKAMTRRLALDRPEAGLNAMSYNDRMRTAADAGLVADPRLWFRFRDLRNRTVHTYGGEQARAVAAEIPEFVAEAQSLLAELQSRNG